MSAIETREHPAGRPAGSKAAVGEKSRVEIEEADPNEKGNWMYSGPARVGVHGPLKVWRQNRATGACEEKELGADAKSEWGTYQRVARKELEGGGERLPSKDFPHAPTKEQELREEEEPAAKK
jgi:hypothetical protein